MKSVSAESGSAVKAHPHNLTVRKALASDVTHIHDLLAVYAKKQILLGRTPEDITANLPGFFVAELHGRFVGCVALRDFGGRLFEVRSLAVRHESKGFGIGSAMVAAAVDSLRGSGKCRIFALTYQTAFFQKLGFHLVEKTEFPQKIWSDCDKCPRKDHCDEDALLIELPAGSPATPGP
jgi:amino-acid N-acetyltransferase